MSTALSKREPNTLQPINGLLLYQKIPTRKLNSKSGTNLYEIITKGNFYVIVRETERKMRLKKAEPSLVHLINKAIPLIQSKPLKLIPLIYLISKTTHSCVPPAIRHASVTIKRE